MPDSLAPTPSEKLFPTVPLSLFRLRQKHPFMEPPGLKETDDLLRNVQANILKAHGRAHTRLLFFEFTGTPGQSRAFLKTCEAENWITSARKHLDDIVDYKLHHHLFTDPKWEQVEILDPKAAQGLAPVVTLNISFLGLEKLALADGHQPAGGSSFESGMHGGKEPGYLGDDLSTWDAHYRDNPPDGLILIAHDQPSAILKIDKEIRRIARDARHAVHFRDAIEDGFEWKPAGSELMREPFGFADGLSNLIFLEEDIATQPATPKWSPIAPLEQVLLNPAQPLLRGCSFLAFRKLEQNQALFADYVATRGLAVAEGDVGRTRDGHPLASKGGGPGNDFNYDQDRSSPGSPPPRCPFHAHIRKANPRTQGLRGALFVRRGLVYAKAPTSDAGALTPPCGLLFLGYMRSISEQFSVMQSMWLKDEDSPGQAGDKVGRDSLLFGQHCPAGATTAERFIVPRGGGYFFVPTRDWLRAL